MGKKRHINELNFWQEPKNLILGDFAAVSLKCEFF